MGMKRLHGRIECRKRQSDKLAMVNHRENGCGGGYGDGDLDDPELPKMDEGRQPLSRKLPIPSSKISPYRMINSQNGVLISVKHIWTDIIKGLLQLFGR
ncbi:hypothetical protein L1987_81667 [Smallanthus sonchifolius]|uniref:Uncharacterized protein n=1 Tax=Smallanthus sonchifolius TaxID=185202 RepID=A0ACB8YR20_9ASTR|nr:hypothetical protein L1987_81667 [Smallanthus sonchifolius]